MFSRLSSGIPFDNSFNSELTKHKNKRKNTVENTVFESRVYRLKLKLYFFFVFFCEIGYCIFSSPCIPSQSSNGWSSMEFCYYWPSVRKYIQNYVCNCLREITNIGEKKANYIFYMPYSWHVCIHIYNIWKYLFLYFLILTL